MTRVATFGSQRGIALFLVLWTMTLLSLLVVSFAQQTRLERHRTSNLIDAGKARSAVQAGLSIGVAELLRSQTKKGWRHDGTPNELPLDDARLTISLQDSNGCLNLNNADLNQLNALLRTIGVKNERARAIAAAIVDWRDPDNLVTPNGAELPTYVEAGAAARPGNRPFLSVDELNGVLGMTADIAARLLPLVTVYTAASEVNPETAPEDVLRATLPAEEARAIMSRRNKRAAEPESDDDMSAGLSSLNEESKDATAADLAEVAEGPLYSVEISATMSNGVTANGRAVVWLTRDVRHPYRILDWRPGQDASVAADSSK